MSCDPISAAGDLPGRAGDQLPASTVIRGRSSTADSGKVAGTANSAPRAAAWGPAGWSPRKVPRDQVDHSRREPLMPARLPIVRFELDENDDGQVTSEELPSRMRTMMNRGDTGQDGSLDREEIEVRWRRRTILKHRVRTDLNTRTRSADQRHPAQG